MNFIKRKIKSFLICTSAVLLCSDLIAGISLQGTPSKTGCPSGCSSFSFSFSTSASTDNTILFVVTSASSASNTIQSNSVTWNGVSLTRVTRTATSICCSAYEILELWYLANPTPSTTANVVVTESSSSGLGGSALEYSGVDLTNLWGAASTTGAGSGVTKALSFLTSTQAGSLLLSYVVDPTSTSFDAQLTARALGGSNANSIADMPAATTGYYAVTNTSGGTTGFAQHFRELLQYNSPTSTITPTYTSTNTPTDTPTITLTTTLTASSTASPTWTPTATPTASPTWTPTATPTASPTWTPTASPSFTPTASPTWTPTASPSFTPTASPTWTPTATSSSSPTPTFTPTVVINKNLYLNNSFQFYWGDGF